MHTMTIIKGVTMLATSIGTREIVKNAVKATTPAAITTLQKVAIQTGTMAISGVVAKVACDYMESGIDSIGESLKNMFSNTKEKIEEITESKEEA